MTLAEEYKITFNPFDKDFINNPYPLFHLMQKKAPLYRNGKVLILTRHEDVNDVLSDDRLSSTSIPALISRLTLGKTNVATGRVLELSKKAIVFTDLPEHTRLRKLVGKCFTPAIIKEFQEHFEEEISLHFDKLEVEKEVDAIEHVTEPIAHNCLRRIMGMDAVTAKTLDHYATSVRLLLEPNLVTPRKFNRICSELEDCFEYLNYYIKDLKNSGRKSPKNIPSLLIEARDKTYGALSIEEVIYTCMMVFIAGKETTKALIGNGLHLLSKNSTVFNDFKSNIFSAENFVRELLRYDTPLQYTRRLIKEDMEFKGMPLKKGEEILLCFGAANRDSDVFSRPDVFDPNRKETYNLAMGQGMHYCLGAMLSKLVASLSFSQLINRFESLSPGNEVGRRIEHSFLLRGFSTLPLRFS